MRCSSSFIVFLAVTVMTAVSAAPADWKYALERNSVVSLTEQLGAPGNAMPIQAQGLEKRGHGGGVFVCTGRSFRCPRR
ncbi:hypothetical protein HGRIS_009465 [Hohenbuehelia grisea]|uniref:Uncharacterized protein n=1 Tax=Hohenbuehelia grisea TaxID=104357 RepID=A0ABR3J1L8_9AGAR